MNGTRIPGAALHNQRSWPAALIALAVVLPILLPYRVLPWPSTIPNAVASMFWSLWVFLVGLQAYRSNIKPVATWAQASWLMIIGWIVLQTRFIAPPYADGLIFPIGALALAWAIHTMAITLTDGTAKNAIDWLAVGMLTASVGTTVLQLIQLTESPFLAGYVMPLPVDMQPFGNLAQRNQAAFVHVTGIACLAYLFRHKSTPLAPRHVLLWAVMCLPMIAGLSMSASRLFAVLGWAMLCANIIQLLSAFDGSNASKYKIPILIPHLLLAGSLFYLASYSAFVWLAALISPDTVAFDNVVERMGNVSNLTRIALQQQAWAMFTEHPFIGNGWGSFSAFALEWSEKSWLPLFATHSHILPTHWLAELGLLGLAAALPLSVLVWSLILRTNRSSQAFLLKCLLTLTILYSLSEYPLWEGYFLFPFAFMLGLLHRQYCNQHYTHTPNASIHITPFAPMVVSIILSICSAWSASAYFKIHLLGQKVFTGQSVDSGVFKEIANMRQIFGFSSIMDVYLFASMPANPEMLKEQIKLGERVSGQFVDANILRQLGFLYILEGNQNSASRTFQNLCRFYPEKCPELLTTLRNYADNSTSETANQVWADLNRWFTTYLQRDK